MNDYSVIAGVSIFVGGLVGFLIAHEKINNSSLVYTVPTGNGSTGIAPVVLPSGETYSGVSVSTAEGSLNNPGNIEHEAAFYTGEINSPNPTYKSFSDLSYGYLAMITKLRSYYSEGYNTLTKAITHWVGTPNPDYIPFVAGHSNIDPNADFQPFLYSDSIKDIIKYMSIFEQGSSWPIYDTAIDNAYQLSINS